MGRNETIDNATDSAEPPPAANGAWPTNAKFTWPPRPIAVPLEDELNEDQRSEPASQSLIEFPRSAWEEFEHEWLGVTTAPLKRRLAEAGAAPDAINAFCWRCARTIGPFETDAKGCSSCRGTRPHWSRFVRLAEYTRPWSRIVQDAKFTRWPRLGVDLGRMLGRQIAAAVPDLGNRPTIIVPVPTNYYRRIWRGTDHALNLARGVSSELRLPLRPLLSRARRPEQARLSATDRLTNLNGAMRRAPLDALWASLGVSKGFCWPCGAASARLILVDDISTTGATMGESCRAARRVCKSIGVKDLEIVAATVCRTEPHGRGGKSSASKPL